jgi:hypothetical protein
VGGAGAGGDGVLLVFEYGAAECGDCEFGVGEGKGYGDFAESFYYSLLRGYVFADGDWMDFGSDEFAGGVGEYFDFFGVLLWIFVGGGEKAGVSG